MSSILKALRKAEDDKAALGEGHVDLAHSILKSNYPGQRRIFQNLLIVGVLAVFLVGLLGGGWLWLTRNESVGNQAGFDAESQPPAMETARQPLPSLVDTSRSDELAASEPRTSAIEKKMAVDSSVQPVETVRSQAEKSRSDITASSTEETSANVQLPNLRVDEIVFQASAETRLAIINDLPVMQGTDIDGARVIEIFPDKVRFLYRGVQFDKPIADTETSR